MKDIIECTPIWYQCAIIFCALLILVSFLLPPLGVIDNSVLIAVGELGGFSLLGMLPSFIKHAKSVKIEKGDTSVEIETKDK